MSATSESSRKAPSRLEPLVYALFAGVCTLYVGCLFYSSLRLQTLYARLWHDPAQLNAPGLAWGEWSAPLDDVFIHFDFARSTARGFPFQWSPGNGYSSGGTSPLYPLLLAIGYWVGYRRSLMAWAAILALVSVFAYLLANRRLFRNLPRGTSYLLPPAFLCTGVLNWSLFSGMEVAVFLALWAGALIAWDDLLGLAESAATAAQIRIGALLLGVWGASLVATRPESVATLAVFSGSAFFVLRRQLGTRKAWMYSLLSLAPGSCVLIAHAAANYVFTGDTRAAGAQVKLELYHPFLSSKHVLDAWWFHFKYQILRVTGYHLTSTGYYGFIAWFFALISLAAKSTRRYALLLWASSFAWIALVALNGQVRWQNERYTMPALAWMLCAAALGISVLLTQGLARRRRLSGVALVAGSVSAAALFVFHERPRFREQLWFFGRAARNILDQHVRAGTLIRNHLKPRPRRILVGDAGAIPYAADLPALDIIGLGGYRDLPFARATQLGVGAAIELIQRMPDWERPDLMAIYPTWWGNLPLWFGARIPGAEVPVRGNVICGGASKVLYYANWRPLSDTERAFSVDSRERLVDALDFADVMSEDAHRYRTFPRGIGHIEMKMLAHPRLPARDLWDAGRIIPPGARDSFELRGFKSGASARLLFRVAPASRSQFRARVAERDLPGIELKPSDVWQEISLTIPGPVPPELKVELETLRGERILYHVWAFEPR